MSYYGWRPYVPVWMRRLKAERVGSLRKTASVGCASLICQSTCTPSAIAARLKSSSAVASA